MKHLWILLAGSLCALITGCSVSDPPTAGGGGEITNGVCAIDGIPVEGMTVMAFPVDYMPLDPGRLPLFAVTDSLGRFSFDLYPGTFNIFAIDTVSLRGAYIPDVRPGISLDSVALLPLGAISGAVARETPNPMPIDIYIKGSPFYTTLSGPESFMLNNMPSGEYIISIRTVDMDQCTPGLLCTGREVLHSIVATVPEGQTGQAGIIDITQPPP